MRKTLLASTSASLAKHRYALRCMFGLEVGERKGATSINLRPTTLFGSSFICIIGPINVQRAS